MTRAELVDHLGTIAKSGSRDFLARLRSESGVANDAGAGFIGQFGVGFYSAFMVAKKVTVLSRSGARSRTRSGGGPAKAAAVTNIAPGGGHLPRGTKSRWN